MLERYSGTCEPFASVDVSRVVAWLQAIPFEAWPQQGDIPGMLTDKTWHGWGDRVDSLVTTLLRIFFPRCRETCYALNAIMPGRAIGEHVDQQCPKDWVTRVHVPLLTNPQAVLVMEGIEHHMQVGKVYHVNPNRPHSLRNDGKTPRVHFFFDVLRPLERVRLVDTL